MSPTCAAEALDPIVAATAKRLAAVINSVIGELDQRDGTSTNVTGRLELALQSQTFELTIVHDGNGKEYLIDVLTRPKSRDATNNALLPSKSGLQHVQRPLDAGLEPDLMPRKKRMLQEDASLSLKERRVRNENEEDPDRVVSITKKDLEEVLSQVRNDMQEDTSDSINHVQCLLRSFKDEWHDERSQIRHTRPSSPDLIPRVASHAPTLNRNDYNTSIAETIRREAKLTSAQIKWVEDCRRIAADMHNQREETWRTSSASFHERQRQHREAFETRLLQETILQARH
jgi:hypothetical protein